MKTLRIFYSAIVLFTIAICLVSCQKENIKSVNELKQDVTKQGELSMDELYTLLEKDEELQNYLKQLGEESNDMSRMPSSSTSYCHPDDWYGLKALYNSLNGSEWEGNYNWDVIANYSSPPLNCDLSGMNGVSLHTDLNKWYTTISNLGRVRGVSFYSFGESVAGTIPWQVKKLEKLNFFTLSGQNAFTILSVTGSIPWQFRQLPELYSLTITDTEISGSIPAALGNSPSLRWLTLRDNQLTYLPSALSNLSNTLLGMNLKNNNLCCCYKSELASLCDIQWGVNTQGNYYDNDFTTFCATGGDVCPY